jgi:hypothetical protein
VPAWFGPGAVGKGAANRGNLADGLPVLLGAIRSLNRLELAGETLRAGLEALAVAAPDWLTEVIDGSWQDVYGARIDNLRLPESATKREKLMVQFGRDGYHLLDQVYGPGAPGWLRELPAVQAVRRIWIQQFYRDVEGDRQEVRRRENAPEGDGLPPGRDRLISPYDLDAHYSVKRDHDWGGYKVHFTETCNPPAPNTVRAAMRALARTRPGATYRI